MGYTEEQCIKSIEELYSKGDLNRLYDENCVNRNGVTTDTKREYQEICAEYIYNRLIDGRLPMIDLCDVKEYCTVPRKDDAKEINEESVQRDFYFGRLSLDSKYGKPVWFELQANGHGRGKGIDLVYYNETTHEINIFELKHDNDNETLLRAVLEIQTYYQRVDWFKAIHAPYLQEKLNSEYIAKINKYILFNQPCRNIFKKYNNLSDNSYVQKLIKEFNIGIVLY